MSTEYTPLEVLETHLPIPADGGPGYCRGCDWESRQIGIASHLQHRAHVAQVIAEEVATHDRAVKAEALREAADDVHQIDGRQDDAAADWLRARADEMEKEATDD